MQLPPLRAVRDAQVPLWLLYSEEANPCGEAMSGAGLASPVSKSSQPSCRLGDE